MIHPPFAIAIHGGCGVLVKAERSAAEWAEARAALAASLMAGWRILRAGGTAIDAVEAAVVVMEDSPHFNAGHGAALTARGEHELEATIMDGRDRSAGAVTLARHVKNPVRAARKVWEAGDAVILGGPDADAFARERGLAMVDQAYFTTEARLKALASLRRRASEGTMAGASEGEKHGTVGAVALDKNGDLAAATSTGGYNNKPAGRIGDSPIPCAGTYAKNGTCAVSGTGRGEYFIRFALAREVAARMDYLKEDVSVAARAAIDTSATPDGIGAGMVAIDAAGTVTAPYNTEGMFRGWITTDGRISVAIHEDVLDLGLAQ